MGADDFDLVTKFLAREPVVGNPSLLKGGCVIHDASTYRVGYKSLSYDGVDDDRAPAHRCDPRHFGPVASFAIPDKCLVLLMNITYFKAVFLVLSDFNLPSFFLNSSLG